MLGLVADPSSESDAFSSHFFEATAFWSLPDDEQPAANLWPNLFPQFEQEIDSLVRCKAPESDEQRLGGFMLEESRCMDAVLEEANLFSWNADVLQRCLR